MQFVEDGSDIYQYQLKPCMPLRSLPHMYCLYHMTLLNVLYTISTGIYPLFEFDLDHPVKKAVESGCEYKLDAAYTTIMYVSYVNYTIEILILFQCRHVHEPLQ